MSIWVLQHLHGDTNNNNNNNNETKDKFHMEKILELDAPNVTRLALYEHYLGLHFFSSSFFFPFFFLPFLISNCLVAKTILRVYML